MFKKMKKDIQGKLETSVSDLKEGLDSGIEMAQQGLESAVGGLKTGAATSLQSGGSGAKIAAKAAAKGIWRAVFTMLLGTSFNWFFLAAMSYPVCKTYCTGIDTANISFQSVFALSGNLVMAAYVAFFLFIPPFAYFILGKSYGIVKAARVVFNELKEDISKLFGLILLNILESVDSNNMGRDQIRNLMRGGLKTFDKIPRVLRKVLTFFINRLPFADILEEMDIDLRNTSQEDIAQKFSDKVIEFCDDAFFSPPTTLRNIVMGINFMAIIAVFVAVFI